METELDKLRWFTSSFSASGACVEVAHLPGGGVGVRDSKDRGKAPHIYTQRAWEAFLARARNGEFDLPLALAVFAWQSRQPNSPSRALATKVAHCAAGNTRAGPAGRREFLTATRRPARIATSTQLPPVGPLRVLFTHRAPGGPAADVPARTSPTARRL
jgi:Domain of unknown function (DUF397)